MLAKCHHQHAGSQKVPETPVNQSRRIFPNSDFLCHTGLKEGGAQQKLLGNNDKGGVFLQFFCVPDKMWRHLSQDKLEKFKGLDVRQHVCGWVSNFVSTRRGARLFQGDFVPSSVIHAVTRSFRETRKWLHVSLALRSKSDLRWMNVFLKVYNMYFFDWFISISTYAVGDSAGKILWTYALLSKSQNTQFSLGLLIQSGQDPDLFQREEWCRWSLHFDSRNPTSALPPSPLTADPMQKHRWSTYKQISCERVSAIHLRWTERYDDASRINPRSFFLYLTTNSHDNLAKEISKSNQDVEWWISTCHVCVAWFPGESKEFFCVPHTGNHPPTCNLQRDHFRSTRQKSSGKRATVLNGQPR